MGQSSKVRIAGRVSEIAEVADLVDAFSAYHRLPNKVALALNVALDEILNNVMSYGYDTPAGQKIMVRLTLRREAVEAVVLDNGRPFNPLTAPEGGARADGRLGVGLRFVRTLTDEMRYMRRNGANRLCLVK